MERNVYAPPEADVTTRRDRPRHRDASKGVRFANYFLDQVAVVFVGVVVMVFLFTEEQMESGAADLLFVGLSLGYFLVLEGTTGRTIGKWITGTAVVAEDGERPGFGKVLGRTLTRWVPFEPFSFLGSRPIGWHDRWSGTRVVKVRGVERDAPGRRRARR